MSIRFVRLTLTDVFVGGPGSVYAARLGGVSAILLLGTRLYRACKRVWTLEF